MKKIILTILLFITMTACSNDSIFTKLSYDELNKKIENEETFILLFNDESRNGELLKHTLEKVVTENDLTAYEINSSNLKETQKNNLRPLISYQDASIVFIINGKDPSKLTHITDELTDVDELTSHLTNLGFIKTDEKTSNE